MRTLNRERANNALIADKIVYASDDSSIEHFGSQILNASILVIDENLIQGEQILNLLVRYFSSVKMLSNSAEALKIGTNNSSSYDLIISDMKLSKTDVTYLCSEFLSKEETRYTPILLFSSDHNKNNLVKAFNIGADDFLLAPLNGAELIVRASLQIKRKKYQDSLRRNLFSNIEMFIRDPLLTNCYNRRYFDASLKSFVRNSVENGRRLSIMILDIDYFKLVNDYYGHIIGDELLKKIQRKISKNIRTTDLLARFGGEEFAIVMPDTNISDAYTLAEKIRKTIADESFLLSDKKITHSITASIGVTEMQETDLNHIEKFLMRADMHLYKAKNSGKNRVVIN